MPPIRPGRPWGSEARKNLTVSGAVWRNAVAGLAGAAESSAKSACAPADRYGRNTVLSDARAARKPPREPCQTSAITRTSSPKTPPSDDSLAFGNVFTDHMFLMNYDEGKGWHDPRIVPYGPFTLDPATCVLHYGQGIFDGLKAFRGQDGHVRLFRLPDHARRLNRSAHYLCIPELDPAMVEESIRALVEVDQHWVPKKPGTSLYIRPTVIATETFLGVHPSHSVPVLRDHRAGRRLLQRGHEPGSHPRLRPARPRGQGRTGRREDDGQLRREPVRRRGSAEGRLYASAVAGRGRAQVSRRGRHHEHHGEDRR